MSIVELRAEQHVQNDSVCQLAADVPCRNGERHAAAEKGSMTNDVIEAEKMTTMIKLLSLPRGNMLIRVNIDDGGVIVNDVVMPPPPPNLILDNAFAKKLYFDVVNELHKVWNNSNNNNNNSSNPLHWMPPNLDNENPMQAIFEDKSHKGKKKPTKSSHDDDDDGMVMRRCGIDSAAASATTASSVSYFLSILPLTRARMMTTPTPTTNFPRCHWNSLIEFNNKWHCNKIRRKTNSSSSNNNNNRRGVMKSRIATTRLPVAAQRGVLPSMLATIYLLLLLLLLLLVILFLLDHQSAAQ